MAEARAASFKTRSIKNAAKNAGLLLALRMVDLTTLEGKDSPEKVRALCRKAVCPGFTMQGPLPPVAAVCVYPSMIPHALEALREFGGREESPRSVSAHQTHIKVAAVATGFVPVTLGPRVLRAETAPLAVLGALLV